MKYIYKCKKCGSYFEKEYSLDEVNQNLHAPEKQICPFCGSNCIKRVYTSPGLRFIGSGFYVTDYGKKILTDSQIEKQKKEIEHGK